MSFLSRVCSMRVRIPALCGTMLLVYSVSFASVAGSNGEKSEGLYAAFGPALNHSLSAALEGDSFVLARSLDIKQVPAVARLRNADLHYELFSGRHQLRLENKAAVQRTVFGKGTNRVAGAGDNFTVKCFGGMPAVEESIEASEPNGLPVYPLDPAAVEDAPVLPTLPDGNFLDVGSDTPIIVVQVLTLFDNEARRCGELDFYLGFNSTFDEDDEQSNALPRAGQTVYGALNWTF